jgi:hypothetical protein
MAVELFWSDLGDVLTEIDGMADEAAAEMLIEFLEGYRDAWPTIAGRRALFARARLVLAERTGNDERAN